MRRGHIHVRRNICKDGTVTTTFYVVVDGERHPNGRRRQKWHGGFRTRIEAERVRAELVNHGQTRSQSAVGGSTFAEWIFGRWLPNIAARVKPATLHSYRRNLEIHVLPVIGDCPLSDLSPQQLNDLYSRLLAVGGPRGVLSPKTVHYIHMTIHKALADAVEEGQEVLARNPAARAKPPLPHTRAVSAAQVWELDELIRFLGFVHGTDLDAVWRLAAMTGMRRGEVLGLRWSDVDLLRHRISVKQARVLVDGVVMTSTPKSGRGRVIDIDARTGQLLQAHRMQQQLKLGGGDGLHAQRLVALDAGGEPLRPDFFSAEFRRLTRLEGLRVIRLHDLRHTHATLLLKSGVPVKVVSERLGHQSPALTLAVYAHVLPGMQAGAAAELGRLVDERAASEDPWTPPAW